MTENQQTDTSYFPPDAAALYQRMQEDPETALQEAFASDNKETLNWLLNNAPEFRPVGSVPATILGWTEGTGVWVLEGSEENHHVYGQICDENPGIEHNEALKKAGAMYYENCKFGALSQDSVYILIVV